jgi:hypothetical protein
MEAQEIHLAISAPYRNDSSTSPAHSPTPKTRNGAAKPQNYLFPTEEVPDASFLCAKLRKFYQLMAKGGRNMVTRMKQKTSIPPFIWHSLLAPKISTILDTNAATTWLLDVSPPSEFSC